MTEKLAHRLAMYFEAQNAVCSDKLDLLEYGIFHFVSSLLHILFLLVAGILLSALAEITVFCLCFCTLKHYIGGAHAQKHWVCLWGFTLLAALSAVVVRYLDSVGLPAWVAPLASAATLLIILFRAPILHPNSPMCNPNKLAKFRKKAIGITLVQFVIISTCLLLGGDLSMLALCGAAGGVAAAGSLLIPICSG